MPADRYPLGMNGRVIGGSLFITSSIEPRSIVMTGVIG